MRNIDIEGAALDQVFTELLTPELDPAGEPALSNYGILLHLDLVTSKDLPVIPME